MPQLRQYGYRMNAKEDVRHDALKKVIKQTGSAPVISKLVQLRTYRKHASPRSNEARHKKVLTRDIEFVQRTRNEMTERQRTLDKKKTTMYRSKKI
jgi:hypothetical protein